MPTDNKSEIVIFKTADEKISVDVRFEGETVWLTQAQLVDLYGSSKANVSEHIKHIFEEEELEEDSVVRNFRTAAADGKSYQTKYYNLDMIISLGYRKEILARIRDIRSSEKVIYRQVLDLYATSADYNPKSAESVAFFKMVQNKLHYAVNRRPQPKLYTTGLTVKKNLWGLHRLRELMLH